MRMMRFFTYTVIVVFLLSVLTIFYSFYWDTFHLRTKEKIDISFDIYSGVLANFYIDKPVERVSTWITFIDRKGIDIPNTFYSAMGAFFAELFRLYPERMTDWFTSIDSLSEKSKKIFVYAIWLSGTEAGKKYLKKYSDTLPPPKKAEFEKLVVEIPPNFKEKMPPSPEINDMLWGSFFASGNPQYLKNLIAVACLYDVRNDSQTFWTAVTAKWSLASNAKKHYLVAETLRKEIDSHKGFEKDIIQDISDKAELVNGPEIILIEAEQIIKQQQSEGRWLESR